jgi:hypothetical protein
MENRSYLLAEISKLKSSLSNDLLEDMEKRDMIHKLEMRLNNVKPTDSSFECFGCGS